MERKRESDRYITYRIIIRAGVGIFHSVESFGTILMQGLERTDNPKRKKYSAFMSKTENSMQKESKRSGIGGELTGSESICFPSGVARVAG